MSAQLIENVETYLIIVKTLTVLITLVVMCIIGQAIRRISHIRNKRIHSGIVAAHEKLERKLKKIGVEIKPVFNIAPPLG